MVIYSFIVFCKVDTNYKKAAINLMSNVKNLKLLKNWQDMQQERTLMANTNTNAKQQNIQSFCLSYFIVTTYC